MAALADATFHKVNEDQAYEVLQVIVSGEELAKIGSAMSYCYSSHQRDTVVYACSTACNRRWGL